MAVMLVKKQKVKQKKYIYTYIYFTRYPTFGFLSVHRGPVYITHVIKLLLEV